MPSDAPLPWVAESEAFCAGDQRAMSTWCERLVASTREAMERNGDTPEMLGDASYVAWLAIDTLVAGLKLDRLDASSLGARMMLKVALSMATEAATSDGAVASPSRATKALAGLQLTATHGLQLALGRGHTIGRPN